MIHLTPCQAEELADGVRWGSFTRFGDVVDLALQRYQDFVVGPGAAASFGQPVAGFFLANPGEMFELSIEQNALGIQEYVPWGDTVAGTYFSLPPN